MTKPDTRTILVVAHEDQLRATAARKIFVPGNHEFEAWPIGPTQLVVRTNVPASITTASPYVLIEMSPMQPEGTRVGARFVRRPPGVQLSKTVRTVLMVACVFSVLCSLAYIVVIPLMLFHPTIWVMIVGSIGGILTLAMSAIDTACWDLKGKAIGQPVSAMLGGLRDRAPVYASGALMRPHPIKYLAEAGPRLVGMGFRQMKMQCGSEATIAASVERVRVLRDAIGPDVDLMCDINQLWSVHHAIDVGRRLEDAGLHLYWLEDPTTHDDYPGLGRIAEALKARPANPKASTYHAFEALLVALAWTLQGNAAEATQWHERALKGLEDDADWAGAVALLRRSSPPAQPELDEITLPATAKASLLATLAHRHPAQRAELSAAACHRTGTSTEKPWTGRLSSR